MAIELIDLGIKDYQETLELQYELVNKRINNEIPDTLIFVEHPHVITIGRKTNFHNILEKDIPIYEVERGGDVTYHGPGQLVGYPIIDYSKQKDINKFLRDLEEVIILTLEKFDISAYRKEKYTGVWTNSLKIASIGISFKKWTSYHGFALNISTELDFFNKINPCGLESSIMTSMNKLLSTNVDINIVKQHIFNNFIQKFK